SAVSVATGDINKDDFPDLVFAVEGAPARLALSDGKGRFTVSDLPEATRDARQVMVADYDADGLPDLLALTRGGLRVLRNLGRGEWADVTAAALGASGARSTAEAVAFAVGDLDGDGHVDLVLRTASRTVRRLPQPRRHHPRAAVPPLRPGQHPGRCRAKGPAARGQPARGARALGGHAPRRPRRRRVRPGSAHGGRRRARPLAGRDPAD